MTETAVARVPGWRAQSCGRETVNVARGTQRGNSSKGVWRVEEPGENMSRDTQQLSGRFKHRRELQIGNGMECEHDES